MNALFEIASAVRTPLALAGIVVVVLYLLFRAILKLNIFPKLARKETFQLINRIMTYLFILAIIAIVLGFVSYIFVQQRPTDTPSIFVDTMTPSPPTTPPPTTPPPTTPPPTTPPPTTAPPTTAPPTTAPPTTAPPTTAPPTPSPTPPPGNISVIHFHLFPVTEEEPFPMINITLKNNTEELQYIAGLKIDIADLQFVGALVGARVLPPIAVWDIELPNGTGEFYYTPSRVIEIPPDYAATITIRLFVTYDGNIYPPKRFGNYYLRFIFVCGSGLEAETSYIWIE